MQPILLSLLLSALAVIPLASAHGVHSPSITLDRIGIDIRNCEHFHIHPKNATYPLNIKGFAITIDKNRNVYFCNKANRTINKLNRDGVVERVPTDSNGTFTLPTGLTIGRGEVWVATNIKQVYRTLYMNDEEMNVDVFYPRHIPIVAASQWHPMLKFPYDVVIDPTGIFYLSDLNKDVIHMIDNAGNYKSVEWKIPKASSIVQDEDLDSTTQHPASPKLHMFGGLYYIALDSNGNWFWSTFGHRVHRVHSWFPRVSTFAYYKNECDAMSRIAKSGASSITTSLSIIIFLFFIISFL